MVAEYIISEIKKNIKSQEVKQIQFHLDYDGERFKSWKEMPAITRAYMRYSTEPTVAMGLWAERVFKGRSWDHKLLIKNDPKLNSNAVHRKVRALAGVREARRINEMPVNSESWWHKYNGHDYYLDVWSNIHYGYVGLECGFSEKILLGGADFAQFLDNEQLFIGDAPDDVISMKIGFSLYYEFKNKLGELTPLVVLDRLEAASLISSRETHICNHEFKEEVENSDY